MKLISAPSCNLATTEDNTSNLTHLPGTPAKFSCKQSQVNNTNAEDKVLRLTFKLNQSQQLLKTFPQSCPRVRELWHTTSSSGQSINECAPSFIPTSKTKRCHKVQHTPATQPGRKKHGEISPGNNENINILYYSIYI